MKLGVTYFKIALINGIPRIIENNKLYGRVIVDNTPIFLSLDAACAWLKQNYSTKVALDALKDD